MEETTFARKLEMNGRLMIPIKLREKMGMTTGQEYKFYTTKANGHKFICIDCGLDVPNLVLEEAIRIVRASGMKIVQDAD